jgi:prepilin-type N-terminal cleavage/methylation domain-containing protein
MNAKWPNGIASRDSLQTRSNRDKSIPGSSARAFTLVELLVVISIIATLAGLVVGLAPTVGERMKESRIRAELAELQFAIESYKAKFGIYPPDHGSYLSGTQADQQPGTRSLSGSSPLYYELSGVFVDNANGVFLTADTKQSLSPVDIQRHFGRDGFINAALLNRRRQFTHRLNDRQHAGISRKADAGGLEVLAVGFITDSTSKRGSGFPWPTDAKTLAQYPAPIPANPGLNPWHYVSTSPVHNPGGYDLWAEYFVRGERRILANWKQ